MNRRVQISGWLLAGGALLAVSGALSAGGADQGGAAPVTFAKDIAPIFQEKCEVCHRKDSMAPMSLVTYEETRPWARSIKERVVTHQMPPWHLDKTVGIQQFQNDRVFERRSRSRPSCAG